ncbi:hypothetical protein C922_02834 [Plasmodium inui San Antonio 1]|uniref:Enolpyruvate transferase domain-containing protein n=1 Tax=Plasmodium inui San Antonio 1 TaxID=1237626 RepID=W7ACM3_9APIC|nr:hypothetical protein C922_02834 [Plasmodium inui San Antonio 1]EUD66849.1 hypothetical protein C922_02834 [Plasmodium inui San Antonio 1]
MSLLCDPDAFHLFVEDDLESFFSTFEKERQSTSHIVILTDQATFLKERPTLLYTLKLLLRHPGEDSKGSLSPQGGLYTLQGNLQNWQHADSPTSNLEKTKWRSRLIFPRSDDEDPLGEKRTHSSHDKSTNMNGRENYEQVRQEIRSGDKTDDKSSHQMVLFEAKQGTHLLRGNDSTEIQEIFEKYEQSLVGKAIPTTQPFTHRIEDVLVIISNVQRWDDKVEVGQQLIDLFDRDATLREAQIIFFASEDILESVYYMRRVMSKGLKVHLFPTSGRALVEVMGDAAGSFRGWHRGEQTCDAVKGDRYDETVRTEQQDLFHTDYQNAIFTPIVTHVRTGLLTSLTEEDYKGIFTQTLKLAILNDPKLFSNIKRTDLNQFKKRIKYFLRKLLRNSCKISRRGKRDRKIMNIFRFGTTIGNAIKNVKGRNPLNGVLTNEEVFLSYGIYYELRILYEVDAVDLLLLVEVTEIMMKYRMKYKLSNHYLNYYTHEIIHHLTKGHPSATNSILLVHLTGIGEVHPDVMINVPLCVVCRILCPMISFPRRNMHLSLKGTESNTKCGPFVHIGHVGNKSEAIRVIYVACMSRENICIRNVTACLDVIVFVKILRELNFDIRFIKKGNTNTHPEDLSPKGNLLHIKGNIQRSVFLFKRFTYQRGTTLHVYNCGTVCRFILPLLCLYICKQNLNAKRRKKRVLKWVLLKGSKQMETTRIISPLVQVLRQTFKCVNIEYTKKENYLPICISVKEGANLEDRLLCTEYVRIDNYHSSQFVSSMLLLSAFSDTDTCIGLSFKRVAASGKGGRRSERRSGSANRSSRGSINRCHGRKETPRHREPQGIIPPLPNRTMSCAAAPPSCAPSHHRLLPSLSTKRNATTAHRTQRRQLTIDDGTKDSPPYAATKGEATTHQFSTTSKSYIDLTIRVMKLWGVHVEMKNFCYFVRKGGKSPSYGRRRSIVALRESLLISVKRFICAVKGLSRGRLSPTGGTKRGSTTHIQKQEEESVNIPGRLPVDVEGDEHDLELPRLSRTPMDSANFTPSYGVQNDLGLLIYFIIGCLIRGENCAIDVGLRLDGIVLYPAEGTGVSSEMSAESGESGESGRIEQSEPISHESQGSRDVPGLCSLRWHRIKAVRRQANIPNYSLLNVLLLLGVDIYVEGGGSHRRSRSGKTSEWRKRSRKLYLLTSKRMSIWQEWIRGLLLRRATSRRRKKDPRGRVKKAKWEVFQNVTLKMKLLSNKLLLKVVVDVENFSDDFFSLSVLFCYYLFLHPMECLSFRIKNVRNQNIKESVRVYNSVIILKLFFQNILCIFCDRNSVYISRMAHPVENCLFYRMSEKGEIPQGEAPSAAASPTASQIENSSKYVTNEKGEVYLYVDTQRDHRVIFMVTILSLLGGNVLIDNTGEVEKSFPHFFHYAHRYLGLNVNYTTCGKLHFFNFTKVCRYRLVSGATEGSSEKALSEEPPSEEAPSQQRPPSEVSLMWSDPSPGSNIHHGSTKVENPPHGKELKCIQNHQQRGAKNNLAMKMGEAEQGGNFHHMMKIPPILKESRGGKKTKFTHRQAEDPPSSGDASTNSSSHLERMYLYEEANSLDSRIGEITSAESSTLEGDEDVDGEKSKLLGAHDSNGRGGTPAGNGDVSITTPDESKCGGRQKREQNMLDPPPGEEEPLKETSRKTCDRTATHPRGALLPRDPNYCREYQYEELLHGNDADLFHLINQVNNLNISVICGIRNVGKSYLSKRIKTSSLVIDLDEFILHGPIRFDRLTIDDFRYYEYVTFVSMLYLVYLIFSGQNGHHDSGANPLQREQSEHNGHNEQNAFQGSTHPLAANREAQSLFYENPFFSLQDDVHFYNKKVNRLYHTMKERHFLDEDQVAIQSVTIVLGGGIVEFEKSRQLMDKVKNLLLIRRPPNEIYHLCMNDKVKPPLTGNLQEIIDRRTILFSNLNAFHFAIPSEEDINRCLKNVSMSRNELIVSSFLNFFDYKFFVKPTIKDTYAKVARTGKAILSLRLTEFLSFDYASLDGAYEVVELVVDCWGSGGDEEERSQEKERSREKERSQQKELTQEKEPTQEKPQKTDFLELAIFTIRSYTDRPICVKFPKWVLNPIFSHPPNEGSPERQKKIPHGYTPTELYKYKINIFDVDVNFFKKVKNFMPRKRENIFLIISSYRERVHKGRVATDLHRLDKSEADLIRLTFPRATLSDRKTLHLEITQHYTKRLGNPPISHVRVIRRGPCHDFPPHQFVHQQCYDISAYTCELNDPMVFLCNDVSHGGCLQPGLAGEKKGGRRPHPENYTHSFYHQGVKAIISCVPR